MIDLEAIRDVLAARWNEAPIDFSDPAQKAWIDSVREETAALLAEVVRLRRALVREYHGDATPAETATLIERRVVVKIYELGKDTF